MMGLSDWQKFFINRPQAEARIRKWLEDPKSKQVLSLVAPPAWGKTWLLHHCREEWEKDGAVAVWIHIPSLFKDGAINIDAFIEEFEKNAKAQGCQKFKRIDPYREMTARLETFMQYVCDCGFKKPPLILADGYDEVSEEQAEKISLQVLDKLIQKRCAKLIVARRVGFAIKGVGIRFNQEVFPLHDTDKVSQGFAKEQFKKIFAEKVPGKKAPDPKMWMAKPKHYQWNHPFANEILFKKGILGTGSLKTLTAQDYFECCKEIIERPDENNKPRVTFTYSEFRTLQEIAIHFNDKKQKEGWTQQQIQDKLGIGNFYTNPETRKFFEQGLIVAVSENFPPYYKIVDGLRELLREFDINKIQFDK